VYARRDPDCIAVHSSDSGDGQAPEPPEGYNGTLLKAFHVTNYMHCAVEHFLVNDLSMVKRRFCLSVNISTVKGIIHPRF
jgi:hypothetical protein